MRQLDAVDEDAKRRPQPRFLPEDVIATPSCVKALASAKPGGSSGRAGSSPLRRSRSSAKTSGRSPEWVLALTVESRAGYTRVYEETRWWQPPHA